MDLTRRGFVQGLVGLAGVLVARKALPELPSPEDQIEYDPRTQRFYCSSQPAVDMVDVVRRRVETGDLLKHMRLIGERQARDQEQLVLDILAGRT